MLPLFNGIKYNVISWYSCELFKSAPASCDQAEFSTLIRSFILPRPFQVHLPYSPLISKQTLPMILPSLLPTIPDLQVPQPGQPLRIFRLLQWVILSIIHHQSLAQMRPLLLRVALKARLLRPRQRTWEVVCTEIWYWRAGFRNERD